MDRKNIIHETLLAIATAAVLVGVPFIGWEYEVGSWQDFTSPIGPLQITIYLVFLSLGLLLILKRVIKKDKNSGVALFIKSALIALLFTPLIVAVPLYNWTPHFLLPSVLVLAMGDWLRPIDIPLHYVFNPILAFVIIYSVIKVTDLRNHYYPDRLCSWGDALKIYLKSNIILMAVSTATLGAVVIFHLVNHLWVERGYMPRADQKAFYDEGGIGRIRLVVTRDIPINLYANFFCGEKGETINYFKTLARTSEAISCLLQIRFVTMDEKQIDFDLSDHNFILRDPERPEMVYRHIETYEKRKSIGIAIDDTCSCTIETPSYKEPYVRCLCELKYVFETPPKEVELVFPGIYIAGEEYQLSPYIFAYHEYLKHGAPNWRGEID